MIAAGKIVLILASLQCDVQDVALEACPEDHMGVYETRTWYDPTPQEMWECITAADNDIRAGGRSKCEIVSGEPDPREDPTPSPKTDAIIY